MFSKLHDQSNVDLTVSDVVLVVPRVRCGAKPCENPLRHRQHVIFDLTPNRGDAVDDPLWDRIADGANPGAKGW